MIPGSWISVLLALSVTALAGCYSVTEAPRNEAASPAAARTSDKADGFVWKISTPEEQQMKSDIINKLDEEIQSKHQRLYSFMIIRNDHIVYEKYYHKRNKDIKTGVFSVNKSVLSALTGIAIDQGVLKLDQKLSSLLPEYFDGEQDDRKKELTIRHTLTMTGGLQTVDSDIQSWFQSPDWTAHVINQPMLEDPGARFSYDTGLTHLLSASLAKSTGMSTKEFADQHLLGPLGIVDYEWARAPEGVYVGGTNFALTPRDMAKLGLLYLHKGQWEGRQLVPQTWVEASIQTQTRVDGIRDYGYLFWTSTVKDPSGKELRSFEASGYGGQHIRVIPDLDLIVVATSNHLSMERSDVNRLIQQLVIPAIQ
jgi:CubicO group peptidase (beta-lactamase class C family)